MATPLVAKIQLGSLAVLLVVAGNNDEKTDPADTRGSFWYLNALCLRLVLILLSFGSVVLRLAACWLPAGWCMSSVCVVRMPRRQRGLRPSPQRRGRRKHPV